jgi:transketolase
MPASVPVNELEDHALQIRRSVLRMASGRGEGYAGQGLGVADIMSALFFGSLRYRPAEPDWADRDRFVLSIGHYVIALYGALAEAGFIAEEMLDLYAADGDAMPASTHHDVPGIESTTGSLGQGLSLACGMALAAMRTGATHRVVALTSDGEQQEGSTWEAAMFAAHHKLDNLTVLVDLNRTQADGDLGSVMEVEPLRAKYEAFGWNASEIDGNDVGAVQAALNAAPAPGRPTAIICHTRLGSGVPFIADRPRAHFVRIDAQDWTTAIEQLEGAR